MQPNNPVPQQPVQPAGANPQPVPNPPYTPPQPQPTTYQPSPYMSANRYRPQVPTPQPIVSSPQANYMPPMPAPSRKRLPLRKIILVGVGLLIIAGGVALALQAGKDDGGGSAAPGVQTTAKGNTAVNTDDYKASCRGDVGFSTAAAYDAKAARIHPMVLFEKGSGGSLSERYVTSSTYLGVDVVPDSKSPHLVELVGCLTRDGSGHSLGNCELQDNDKNTVLLKLREAPYYLDIYAAQTGKKVVRLRVNQTNQACPYFAAYNPKNPVYYTTPDEEVVKAATQTYTRQ